MDGVLSARPGPSLPASTRCAHGAPVGARLRARAFPGESSSRASARLHRYSGHRFIFSTDASQKRKSPTPTPADEGPRLTARPTHPLAPVAVATPVGARLRARSCSGETSKAQSHPKSAPGTAGSLRRMPTQTPAPPTARLADPVAAPATPQVQPVRLTSSIGCTLRPGDPSGRCQAPAAFNAGTEEAAWLSLIHI